MRMRRHITRFHGGAEGHAGPVNFVDSDFEWPAVLIGNGGAWVGEPKTGVWRGATKGRS